MTLSVKRRFFILKRDGFRCVYCGKSGTDVVLHVDHIKSRADGGGDEDDNLAAACRDCNLGKGAISVERDKKADGRPELPQTLSSPGIEGKCFVVFGPDRKVLAQGVVRALIGERCLIQYFDWLGNLSTLKLVELSDMVGEVLNRGPGQWEFFEDDAHLRAWCDDVGRRYVDPLSAEDGEE